MFFEMIRKISSRLSIRARLTFIFVFIFGATFIAFSIFVFNFLTETLQHEFDDALFNYAVDVIETVNLDPSGDLSFQTPLIDPRKIYPFSLGTALIQIRHIKGDILSQVGNLGNLTLPYKKEIDLITKGEEAAYRTLTKLEGLPDKEAESYRLITMSIDSSPQPQLLLQIAVPMTLLETQLENRKHIFEFSIPIVLLISILSGYFFSSRALRPVSAMIQSANKIGAEQLSERLPIPSVKDELFTLSSTLNEMLDRIQIAFQSQERFIADASHQLLTPLAIIRGEIEAALRSNQNPSRDILLSTLQEVEHLSEIVQQLLLLAHVEAGKASLQLTQLSFDDIVIDSINRLNKAAQKKEIKLQFNIINNAKFDHAPLIQGDSNLLQNLVYNLIENAIKYSPEKSTVSIQLYWNSSDQTLIVEDQGPGIPEDQIPFVFNRFHRVPSSISKGYGLGLAIAKKIAENHSARLWVESNQLKSHDNSTTPGTRFFFKIKNF